jgi:hypothetical protein
MWLMSLAATAWVLFRVVPKPARLAYPCTQAALSLSLFPQLLGLLVSGFALSRARRSQSVGRVLLVGAAACATLLFSLMVGGDSRPAHASFDPQAQAAHQPAGVPQGIFPGRVVWVHDPAATNEDCTPGAYGHGWFLNENNNQLVIDSMVSVGLQIMTGTSDDAAAWDAAFRYSNRTRGRGDVGYAPGEKVFLKINVTSSWSGNIQPADLSKVQNQYYGISETSPQLVLAVLRQLVHHAGVPQSEIFVGDPMKHIYKHCYDLWHAEFPSVHYLDHDGWGGREKVAPSSAATIRYSDRGTVLRTGTWNDAGAGSPVTEDHLYTIFEDATYMLNLPTLKGHKHAGITAFAKNHFGSHTRDDARHLHGGLVAPEENNPRRQGYGLYRVQVDLMGHSLLGQKNLFYLLDGLWTSDYEIDDPDRWHMPPFNDDWMSSLFFSQDPVAIESVGFDFLQAEFTPERGLATYPHMVGVDDYLHQAADSSAWPLGIRYDPEEDGSVLGSLGVHEHWNNSVDKQYSRNLGTGEGIELVSGRTATSVADGPPFHPERFGLFPNFPNPFNPTTMISYEIPRRGQVTLRILDVRGREVAILVEGEQPAGNHRVAFNARGLSSGLYVCQLVSGAQRAAIKMILLN